LPQLDVIQNDYGLSQLKIITINIRESWNIVKSYARGSPCLFLRDGTESVWNMYRQNNWVPLNYVIKPDSSQTVYNWMEGFSESTIRNWIDQCLVGVEGKRSFVLSMVSYPNLFSPSSGQFTVIKLQLPCTLKCEPELKIYNSIGKVVYSFPKIQSINQSVNLIWRGQNMEGTKVSSGIYLLQVKLGDIILRDKLTIIK
jgi:hypothetical protein